MEDRCSVFGCSTTVKSGEENYHKLYRFPRDKKRKAEWKEILKLGDVSSSDRVCSLHFLDTDYIQTNLGWRVLIPGAVPQANHITERLSLRTKDIQDPVTQEIKKEAEISATQETGQVYQSPVAVKQEIDKIYQVPLNDTNGAASVLATDTNFILTESSSHKFQVDNIDVQTLPVKRKKFSAGVLRLYEDDDPIDLMCSREVLKPIAPKFQCSQCHKVFSERLVLLMHMTLHYKSGKSICKKCGQIFNNPESYKDHLIGPCHNKLEITRSTVNSRQNASASEHFICTLCGQSFSLHSIMCDHYRTHHQRINPRKCQICPFVTSTSGGIEIHVKDTHLKDRLICVQCKRVFSSMSELWIHTEDLEHGLHLECPECCERFSSMSHLVGHLKSHACVSFFSCEFCQLIFTTPDCVEAHVLNHITAGDKVIKCVFCNDGNSSYQSLHSQFHSHTYIARSRPSKRTPDAELLIKTQSSASLAPSRSSKLTSPEPELQVKIEAPASTYIARSRPSKRTPDAELLIKTQSTTSLAPSHSSKPTSPDPKLQVKIEAPDSDKSTASLAPSHSSKLTSLDPELQIKIEATDSDLSIVSLAAVIPQRDLDSDVKLKCDDCDQVFSNESEKLLHLNIHQSRGDFCCIECGVQCNSLKELTFHYEQHVKSDPSGDGNWTSDEDV